MNEIYPILSNNHDLNFFWWYKKNFLFYNKWNGRRLPIIISLRIYNSVLFNTYPGKYVCMEQGHYLIKSEKSLNYKESVELKLSKLEPETQEKWFNLVYVVQLQGNFRDKTVTNQKDRDFFNRMVKEKTIPLFMNIAVYLL